MAKTLQELYREVMASEELKKEYFAAANEGKAADFLSAHGCDATIEELNELFSSPKNLPQGELADDELDAVAGGTCYHDGRPVVSIYNTCEYWICDRCHVKCIEPESTTSGCVGTCPYCRTSAYCDECKYYRFSDCLMLCYNPARLNN